MSTDKIYGLITGIVINVEDPQKEGRVKISFPELGGDNESYWAPVAAPMAGPGRGAYFMPEVGDEVLVAFARGDVNHPYVLGFLWNGKHPPPSPDTRQRIIYSRNGHAIRFLDSTPDGGSQGALVIEDGHGNRISLSNGKIVIKSVAILEIEAPVITLQGPGYKRVISPNNNPI